MNELKTKIKFMTGSLVLRTGFRKMQLVNRVSRTVRLTFPLPLYPIPSVLVSIARFPGQELSQALIMCPSPNVVNCQGLHQLIVPKGVQIICKKKGSFSATMWNGRVSLPGNRILGRQK